MISMGYYKKVESQNQQDASQSKKQDTCYNARLTQSEIDLLRKDKKEAHEFFQKKFKNN